MKARARANSNIALVKYWGKREVALNLPAAGSLSLTLEGLTTDTTVCFGDTDHDSLLLDGRKATDGALEKALRVIDPIRMLAGAEPSEMKVSITSSNNFPTAAGLASSASGMAALAVAAAAAAGFELTDTELGCLARLGSGSACRSLFGGFAEWLPGVKSDGSDSHAVQLYGPEYWDLRVVVAVVSSTKKPVGSTQGMETCRRTSPLYSSFIESVDGDLLAARAALADRDFAALGIVAERSCSRMHECMRASEPSLDYLTRDTRAVVDAVRGLQDAGEPAFFTIDAGPNVKIFCEPSAVPAIRERLDAIPCVRDILVAAPGRGPERVE